MDSAAEKQKLDAPETLIDDTSQWVTFHIADEKYGVDVSSVQEVLKEVDITPVPGAPYIILGIINLRGNVVTVVDPRRKFNLPESTITEQSRIVVVEACDQEVGLLVDKVSEVVILNNKEIENSPNVGANEASNCFQGVCNRSEEMLILVDLNKMFENVN